MRLEKITLYHVRLELREPFVTSFGSIDDREVLLVKVESGGFYGWGESPHLALPVYTSEYLQAGKHLLKNHILPRFLGKEINDPSEGPRYYSDLKGNNMSKASVEMAIWDLSARMKGLPLYKYLGSQNNRSNIGISIGIQDDIATTLERIDEALKTGYKRIKIKIKPGKDIEVVKSIRETFPDIKLMVDANSAYSLEDIDHLKKLDSYDLMMIEQPFGDEDIIDHSKLQAALKTPICLDESIHNCGHARKRARTHLMLAHWIGLISLMTMLTTPFVARSLSNAKRNSKTRTRPSILFSRTHFESFPQRKVMQPPNPISPRLLLSCLSIKSAWGSAGSSTWKIGSSLAIPCIALKIEIIVLHWGQSRHRPQSRLSVER